MAVRRISELDNFSRNDASVLFNIYSGNTDEIILEKIQNNEILFEASISANSDNNTASYYKSFKVTPAVLGQCILLGNNVVKDIISKINGNDIVKKIGEADIPLSVQKTLYAYDGISCTSLSASNDITCANLTATTRIYSGDTVESNRAIKSPNISCTLLTALSNIQCDDLSAHHISCGTLRASNSISSYSVSCDYLLCHTTAQLTAARALWADFAENYEADAEYPAGTLIEFGGEKEITIAKRIANGVVTTDPGFLINSGCKGLATGIAIAGKVPIRVIGKVQKFDNLTLSNIPGVATVSKLCEDVIIGKALETNESEDEKLVMCVSKFNFK